MTAEVESFFDPTTNTVSYVLADSATGDCAIIDPVWDFDPKSGRTTTSSVTEIERFIDSHGYRVTLILETHAHADHLTAAAHLKQRFDAPVAIGEHIVEVQRIFGKIFNLGDGLARDGSQFDRLIADGERFQVGELELTAMHTPGHTPACMTYVCGGMAFVGDTLFMPDYGSARADFPGGDAATLYRSIRKVFGLDDDTILYLCHDYLPDDGRDEYVWRTTVAEQRQHNVHVRDGVSEAEFVSMREARDATLEVPKLLLPAVQVNIRAGHLPPAEDNGVSYLKVPVNAL